MQYFKDRQEAGQELAKRLERYRDSLSVVIALAPGGVQVGVQLAKTLHLPLGMLAVKEIKLPWQMGPIVGSMDSSGYYSENESLGKGYLEEFESEYRTYIDQEKINAAHAINLMHVSNVLKYDRLRDKNVIITSDGLNSVLPIDELLNYLKPVRISRLVAALPFATVEVIDKLHMSVDEIHCIDVKENYVSTDHYYENNQELAYEDLLNILVDFDTLV